MIEAVPNPMITWKYNLNPHEMQFNLKAMDLDIMDIDKCKEEAVNFFKFFIHGDPINQEWLLFRGPWKKPN